MAHEPIRAVLARLRMSAGRTGAEDLSDARLLQRFAAERDEAAFEALVRRFGPMVLGVCRRVLGDAHEVEDAFQASFLVLARKAPSLARQELLGNWLWGVAYRTARRARADAARWHARERQGRMAPAPDPAEEAIARDLRVVLDEEIDRLPCKYRRPFVLCYLEGKTNAEAARALRCPPGTVFTRLARARELLRGRLTRRGVTLSALGLAAALAREATAAVPVPLVGATARAAAWFAAGNASVAGALSPRAAPLAEGALRAMFIGRLKVAAAVFLAVAVLGGAGRLCRYRALAGGSVGTGGAGAGPPALVAGGQADAGRAGPEARPSRGAADDRAQAGPEAEAGVLAEQAPGEDDRQGGFGAGFGSSSGGGFGFGSGVGSGSGQGFGVGTVSGVGSARLSTLSQKAVQSELGLSEKQLTKLRALQAKQQQALRRLVPQDPPAAFRDPAAASRGLREAPEKLKQLTRETGAAIDAMLSVKQGKRLREIVLQQQRGHALGDPEVAEALQLTREQGQRLQAIEAEGMKGMQEVGFQAMGDLARAGANPAVVQKATEQVGKRLQEIWDDTGDKLLAVLTSEQRAGWQKMTGEPFRARGR
jgi:RNA polymerase sigma factor (sigma-70 family)